MPNTRLYIGTDDKGIVNNAIPWPSAEQSYRIILNESIEKTLPVPEWAGLVSIIPQSGSCIECGYGDTPLELATFSGWTQQSAEVNPILRELIDPKNNPITTLRFISYTDNSYLNVIFYAKDSLDNT